MYLTFAEFIRKHQGQYLDFDHYYGAQCVDLIDYYCEEVLGIPLVYADAVNWFGLDSPYIEWVKNDPGNLAQIPDPLDIVVWGKDTIVGTGIAGHIDVCVTASQSGFSGFDQNWPPLSPCHIQQHSYEGVIGWGKPKIVGGKPAMWTIEQVGDNNTQVQSVSDITEVTDTSGKKSVHFVAVGTDKHPYHFFTEV